MTFFFTFLFAGFSEGNKTNAVSLFTQLSRTLLNVCFGSVGEICVESDRFLLRLRRVSKSG